MQVRWNFKLIPNKSQFRTINDWLITLRKTRNYALRERKQGWDTNNKDVTTELEIGSVYAWGSFCDLDNRIEYGACYPLSCPIQPHGVIPENTGMMIKTEKKTGLVKWDSACGHAEHADTGASTKIARKGGLSFPPNQKRRLFITWYAKLSVETDEKRDIPQFPAI